MSKNNDWMPTSTLILQIIQTIVVAGVGIAYRYSKQYSSDIHTIEVTNNDEVKPDGTIIKHRSVHATIAVKNSETSRESIIKTGENNENSDIENHYSQKSTKKSPVFKNAGVMNAMENAITITTSDKDEAVEAATMNLFKAIVDPSRKGVSMKFADAAQKVSDLIRQNHGIHQDSESLQPDVIGEV